MKSKTYKFIYILLLLTSFISVEAEERFVIEDIRVEGLKRITPGTVFNYLPMKVGDTFSDSLSSDAVRALFKTGFFDDVKVEKDGNDLILIFKERPAIGTIKLSGNEDIKTDELLDNLKQIGFAEGRVFLQSQLEMVEQELHRLRMRNQAQYLFLFQLKLKNLHRQQHHLKQYHQKQYLIHQTGNQLSQYHL